MAKLDTTVAVYDDPAEGEADWVALEAEAHEHRIDIADAAVVENVEGGSVVLQRQSRHGWGKGAVVGAVVGILFPPSIIGAAAVGAGGGAVIAHLTRALGRHDVAALGETLDSGALAVIVVAPTPATNTVVRTLKRARRVTTVSGASVEEVQQILESLPRPPRYP